MASVFGGGGVSAAQMGLVWNGGYAPGLYYPTAVGPVAPGAVAAADTLYLHPFRIVSPVSVAALRVRMTAAGAGSSGKLAWWRHLQSTSRPTGLAVIGSDTGVDTSGLAGWKEIGGLSAALTPGIYWAGSVWTGTLPSLMSVSSAIADFTQIFGTTSAIGPYGTSGTTQRSGFSIAQTYANNIMALDLTGATFTDLAGTIMPAQAFGVAS